jgi:hypothetical protein
MLFEGRACTLRPGSLDTFWGLQRKWNTPTSFRPLLERNIGYFSTTAGPAERIGPLVNESHTALLKPSPVPWMRSLFAPTDWSVS